MDRETQKQRVLCELKRKGYITLADSLSMNPPCYRLSERIRELEAVGYVIRHKRAEGKPYEEYTLLSEPELKEPQKVALAEKLGSGDVMSSEQIARLTQ